ncbi:MAG: VCBS repeat-containing protein, partial [Planctomycetota bacterium]
MTFILRFAAVLGLAIVLSSSAHAQGIDLSFWADLAPGGQPSDIQIADLNNDNLPDLIVLLGSGTAGCCPNGPVLLHQQQADGTFLPPVQLPIDPIVPTEVRIADLNLDGNPDLIVTGVFSPQVEIFYGDGMFGFTSELVSTNVSIVQSLEVAFLDEDAFPDLLIGETGANDVTILFNDGAGGFTLTEIPLPAFSQWSLSALDANQDGLTDILVGTDFLSPNEAYLLTGTGGGAFGLPESIPTSSDIWGTAIGDIDGDGIDDVIGISFTGFDHTVLLGDGIGGFSPGFSIPSTNAAADIEIADFDLDGDLDLVLSRENDTGTDVFENNSFGEFSLSTTLPGDDSYRLAVGDIDLDGDLDLAIASVYNSWAELYRNNAAIVVPASTFRRGDSNLDGGVDIGDVIHTLSFLFVTPGTFGCEDATDA